MYQSNQMMSADELNTFRIKYRNLKVVIIDEISMVGRRTFYLIDTRLQQLTGVRAPFGGLSVIAVGDFYQLKPVGDRLVFLNLGEDAKSLAPNSWKDHFKIYELVDIMRQKDDFKFAQLLDRLRLNEMTEDDKICELVDIMRQKDDLKFAQLLNRLRLNGMHLQRLFSLILVSRICEK